MKNKPDVINKYGENYYCLTHQKDTKLIDIPVLRSSSNISEDNKVVTHLGFYVYDVEWNNICYVPKSCYSDLLNELKKTVETGKDLIVKYDELKKESNELRSKLDDICKLLTPEIVAQYISDNDLNVEQKGGITRIFKESPKFEVDVSASKG